MTTRFAPSPTGRLHLGHAFAALVAHQLARDAAGQFLLRFEDIDHTRARPEFYELIEEDLHWLGMDWDAPPIRQSNRLASYETALASLHEAKVVYPCFCTRRDINEEVARIAHAPHGPEGPLYPGTCRDLEEHQRIERISRGDAHAWRLDATKASTLAGSLSFTDLRFGQITVDPSLLGDVILARKDIATSYHLAVVVDDAAQGITHVTRGEDLLPSTHVHRLLQFVLNLPEPQYLHHELIRDENGKRLATRDQALSLATLRDSGQTAQEILARLPKLGT